MKCDFCGKRARRYEVSLWDATWDWPVKTRTFKLLSKASRFADSLKKQGPNVGMTVLCGGHY